jgi:hypothetical protein
VNFDTFPSKLHEIRAVHPEWTRAECVAEQVRVAMVVLAPHRTQEYLDAHAAWDRSWSALVRLKRQHSPHLAPETEWNALLAVHEANVVRFRMACVAESARKRDMEAVG